MPDHPLVQTRAVKSPITSPQISQLGLHGQCFGTLASPQSFSASSPSAVWRWKPANPVPPRAQNRTGYRWAHLLYPTDACRRIQGEAVNRGFLRDGISSATLFTTVTQAKKHYLNLLVGFSFLFVHLMKHTVHIQLFHWTTTGSTDCKVVHLLRVRTMKEHDSIFPDIIHY